MAPLCIGTAVEAEVAPKTGVVEAARVVPSKPRATAQAVSAGAQIVRDVSRAMLPAQTPA